MGTEIRIFLLAEVMSWLVGEPGNYRVREGWGVTQERACLADMRPWFLSEACKTGHGGRRQFSQRWGSRGRKIFVSVVISRLRVGGRLPGDPAAAGCGGGF